MSEKIKITKNEVIQIIKEEYKKKQTEIALKKRLFEVNSKISNILKEDDEPLEEVQAGGETKVPATGWVGEKNGDTKFKPEFETKGSHKLEEDEEMEIDLNAELGNEESDEESGEEFSMDNEAESIEDILSKLADAIEEKVEDVVDEKIGGTEEISTDEVPAEEITDEEITDEEITDEENQEDGIEETIEENAKESQSGHSPATDQSSDAPSNKTPFTEKQTTINEGAKKGVITEEMKRRQVLAGIRKPDELI